MVLGVVREFDRDLIPWAAGLLVGEGSVGVSKSRHHDYLAVQLSMMDERAVTLFAKACGTVPVQRYELKDRGYPMYKVMLRGRPAERAIAAMWPWIKGTDKGDQALRAARKLRLVNWITGKREGLRPENKTRRRGSPVLTIARVRRLRRLRRTTKLSNSAIARRVGVNYETARAVFDGRTWRNVF